MTFMEGLTSLEAQKLLKEYGLNELQLKKEISPLKIFLSQFTSPLIYVLVLAGIVTIFLKDYADAIVIFLAVLINTLLGFYQEYRAQKTLSTLKSLLAPKAKVIREGKQKEIDAKEIVPGDLVVLTIGDKVPADGVLIEATDLTINEAILTGESVPVKKTSLNQSLVSDKKNLVFAGTIVVSGIGKMRVIKTGRETEIGKIGQAVEENKEEKTPLQIQLGNLAKTLAFIVGGITLVIFVLGRQKGIPFLEIFSTSVAVAVAAIPEGLPVTLTVILALGMQRILKQKAIVRQLLAAETLGSVTTICADKTGTLTEGKLKVVEAVVNKEEPEVKEWLIKAAVLCNDMRDPLEIAMKEWAEEQIKILNLKFKIEDYPRLDAIPFSHQTKLIATFHPGVIFVSGAPEVVLQKCNLQNEEIKTWEKKFEEYGRKGYRLVGFAYKNSKYQIVNIKYDDIKDLTWLGVLVYEDPIRKGVKEALKECQKAGIKIKVITGDYLPTALAVLEKIGLDGQKNALTGEELEKISQKELEKIIDKIVLFARTNPHQKLKIVKALKDKGEVVAMMGDGVNDAPALKKADIGIVVNEASDVAKETADMVLLDSNFATIIHAIEEGRNIFENIKKVTLFLLSSSFAEIILIGGAILLGLPLPVTAGQILWVNLVEDSLPAVALAFEPKQKELMDQPPRGKNTPILDLELKILAFGVGITLNFFLLGLFFLINRGIIYFSHPQTIMFVALGISALLVIFSCRNLRKTIDQYNPFSNKTLNFSIIWGLLFLAGGVYLPIFQKLLNTQPLTFGEWLFLISLGIISIFSLEGAKWLYLKYAKMKN
ncbi:MAG: cation-translocating P-type ATPase [Microgenomates group bacterium]